MAHQQHLDLLKQGVNLWNEWRSKNPLIFPDLSKADLREVKLKGANLFAADLREADLRETDLGREVTDVGHPVDIVDLVTADLRGANLSGAHLIGVNLTGADLSEADLSSANLSEADLSSANLSSANLSEADLSSANLFTANLSGANLKQACLFWTRLNSADLSQADLTGCLIYAVDAWNVLLESTVQYDLRITHHLEPTITVDDVVVAQFIFFLLHHQRLHKIVANIASNIVLIAGRFTNERKQVLQAIKDDLRKREYIPVVYDVENVEKPEITEPLSLLARIAQFVVVDITEAEPIMQELQVIVPKLSSTPVQPLVQVTVSKNDIPENLKNYPWVLKTYQYADVADVLPSIKEYIIDPAEQKAKEVAKQ